MAAQTQEELLATHLEQQKIHVCNIIILKNPFIIFLYYYFFLYILPQETLLNVVNLVYSFKSFCYILVLLFMSFFVYM